MPTTQRKTACFSILLLYGFAGFLLLASSGCRSARDNQIDLLERELRANEDYIYELEDYVVEYSEKLRDCRCTTPHESIIYSQPQSSSSSKNHKSNKVKRSTEEPDVIDLDQEEMVEPDEPQPEVEESVEPEKIIPEELDIPELDISEPVGSNETSDPFLKVSPAAYEVEVQASPRQIFIPDPALFEADATIASTNEEEFTQELFEISAEEDVEIVAEEPTYADRTAEQLVVARLFRSGGATLSPASLLTVVEARDAFDEPVDLNGEVSLMVMTSDPDSPQRLHRWDFTREETTTAWQSSELGDGLHMELPLEETQLPATTLELWVRLVTQDGRKLLTQLPFEPSDLLAVDDATPAEEIQSEEQALLVESGGSKPLRLAQTESNTNALRPAPAAPKKDKPRWRASMQRTHALTEGFSTTSPARQRWSAQSGNRMPTSTAVAIRPTTGTQSTKQKTTWTTEPKQRKPTPPTQWAPYR